MSSFGGAAAATVISGVLVLTSATSFAKAVPSRILACSAAVGVDKPTITTSDMITPACLRASLMVDLLDRWMCTGMWYADTLQ
jgi:hypothetical protein